MSIFNSDQAPRQRHLDDKAEVKDIFIKLLTGFGIFAVMVTIFTIFSISNAKATTTQCSITGAEFDNLMSEDMAAFTALNPGEYDEGDME